jgi:hypothetical protein
VLVLEPALGPLAATLLELPVILLASWLAARWLVRRFAISGPAASLAMGGLAFALLALSEFALALALPGNSPSQWMARMATPPGALGLAGQMGFALMPWAVAARVGG